MMRISYRRTFWGATLMYAALWGVLLILYLGLGILVEEEVPQSDISEGIVAIIFSPFAGLFGMLVLKVFGKKEEKIIKEEPKEKIIYVVKEESKERKENKEDDTRYMPH